MGKLQKARGKFLHILEGQRASLPLLLLALLAVAVAAMAEWQSPLLRYAREGVLQGEFWRLLSGHLVHLGLSHLLLNLGGLGLVLLLFGRGVSAAGWAWLVGSSVVAIGLGFVFFSTGIEWYVGLSGILHGLILGGALLDRGFPCRERNILLGIVVFKLLWEQQFGALPMTAEAAGGAVVVDAHWYGGMGGVAGALIWRGVTRFLNSRSTQV